MTRHRRLRYMTDPGYCGNRRLSCVKFIYLPRNPRGSHMVALSTRTDPPGL
jgi:hypothetical protein